MKNEVMVQAVKVMEKAIAVIFMVAIAGSLVICVFEATGSFMDGSFRLEAFMETILTLVVGIEFVRMLILHTPQSVIEVLLYAVARQIVISHESAMDNLIGVLAILLIFVIKKYLLDARKEQIDGGNDDEG